MANEQEIQIAVVIEISCQRPRSPLRRQELHPLLRKTLWSAPKDATHSFSTGAGTVVEKHNVEPSVAVQVCHRRLCPRPLGWQLHLPFRREFALGISPENGRYSRRCA